MTKLKNQGKGLWYRHYERKYGSRLIMDDAAFKKNLENDSPYLKMVLKHLKPPAHILEAGCGPARAAMSMSTKGFDVTAIDNDKDLLRIAKRNARKFDGKMIFKALDFNDALKEFGADSFDACTHQGVLEHFSIQTIRKILRMQLQIAPLVIFSVPIDSKRNRRYFYGGLVMHNIWPAAFWKENVLKSFEIVDSAMAKQRTDNLIVVIKRKSRE